MLMNISTVNKPCRRGGFKAFFLCKAPPDVVFADWLIRFSSQPISEAESGRCRLYDWQALVSCMQLFWSDRHLPVPLSALFNFQLVWILWSFNLLRALIRDVGWPFELEKVTTNFTGEHIRTSEGNTYSGAFMSEERKIFKPAAFWALKSACFLQEKYN